MDAPSTTARIEPHRDARPGFVEFIALVASLMALNALSIDVMLAGLPAIGASFDVVGDNQPQLVLGSYLVGFAAAQLVWGPLADSFGRRPTLLVGLACFVLASIAAGFAPTFDALLFARFMQGVTAASTRVIAVALVRDCYSGREMGRVMSLAMMVFMVVPILAPGLGQLVLLVASWRWIFGLIFCLSAALLLWSALRLPETLGREARRPLQLGPLLEGYRETLTNRITMGYTLALGVFFGSLFGFLTSAQQVLQEVYGLGLWFAVAFAGIALTMSAASLINASLVRSIGMRPLSHAALICFTVVSLLHLGLALTLPVPFWVFFALSAVTFILFGFIGANFNALAMEPMGHIAGTAASVIGFAQTFLGAVLGSIIGQAYAGTIIPLVGGYALLGVASLAIVAVAERGKLMRPQPR